MVRVMQMKMEKMEMMKQEEITATTPMTPDQAVTTTKDIEDNSDDLSEMVTELVIRHSSIL